MADDVIVEFGAKIDSLITGVDNVNKKLDQIKDHASDVAGALDGLKEIIAGAFSVAAITEFISHMAELGLQTERIMATLGTSAQSTLELGAMAKLTGTSVESLALSIERMSLNIQRSTRDAFSPQNQALQVLGLRTKDFQGLNTDQYIDRLHGAVSKFAPSLNLTNALMAIGGRGIANIIPLLKLQGERWDELRERIALARKGMGDMIPGMAEVHANTGLLQLSLEGLGAAIFSKFAPGIESGLRWLTGLVQKFRDSVLEGGVFGKILDALVFSFRWLTLEAARMVSTLEAIGIVAVAVGKAIANDGNAFDNMRVRLKALNDEFKKTADNILHPPAQLTVNKGGAAGAMDETARSRLEAQIASIQGEINLEKNHLDQQKEFYKIAADSYGITEQQKLLATRNAIASTFEYESNAQALIVELYRSGGAAMAKEYEAAQAKLKLIKQQFITDDAKANEAMVKDWQSKINEGLAGFQSAFNSQLRGLLAGTTSFAQAFKNIMADMIIFAIQQLEKLTLEFLARKAAELLVTAETETGKTAAVAAGTAARKGIELPDVLGSIYAQVSKFFAADSAYLAPAIGPAAPGVAFGEAAAVAATAVGGIAGWEVGTNYVPMTGLALVHEGEQIIPKGQQGPAYQSGNEQFGGGRSTNVSVNISANDSRDVRRFFEDNKEHIVRLLKRELRTGLVYNAR